jgi:heterotetrameric sarcosine oxidase gamma subunit
VADLTIEQRAGFTLATVMARKGVSGKAIGAVLGVAAPDRPGWSRGDDGLMLIGTGAGSWLAQSGEFQPGWAERLRDRLAGLASVSDQSDGYAITRLSGEGARKVLQRGAGIDFHPQSFAPGSAATTMIAHIGVIVWQVDEEPTYDVATFRSYSDSFRHWLDQTAAAL